jgi:hypothetical protein
MNKKFIPLVILTLIFFLPAFTEVSASPPDKKITPYGDYCTLHSHYGKSKSFHTYKQAEEALRHYYSKKGLEIQIIGSKERFMKAHVMKEGEVVDTVVFDRHTGRIRSIY